MKLIVAITALQTYIAANDTRNDGSAADEARMLARDVEFDGYSTPERKQEVVLSRLYDTYDACDTYGFTRSGNFQALWDDVVLSAIAEGYNVTAI